MFRTTPRHQAATPPPPAPSPRSHSRPRPGKAGRPVLDMRQTSPPSRTRMMKERVHNPHKWVGADGAAPELRGLVTAFQDLWAADLAIETDASPFEPSGSGRVEGGCTSQDLLPLHFLPSSVAQGGGGPGKTFFPFIFFCGTEGGGGARGKAFFPLSCCCGTGSVGGGTKRSPSESDDGTSFFFTSLPREEAKRGVEKRPNSSSLDTCSFERVAVKTCLTSTSWRHF